MTEKFDNFRNKRIVYFTFNKIYNAEASLASRGWKIFNLKVAFKAFLIEILMKRR